jgi:hypothetical protein
LGTPCSIHFATAVSISQFPLNPKLNTSLLSASDTRAVSMLPTLLLTPPCRMLVPYHTIGAGGAPPPGGAKGALGAAAQPGGTPTAAAVTELYVARKSRSAVGWWWCVWGGVIRGWWCLRAGTQHAHLVGLPSGLVALKPGRVNCCCSIFEPTTGFEGAMKR